MVFKHHIPEGQLASTLHAITYFKHYMPPHEKERLVPDQFINVIIELDEKERYVYNNQTLRPKITCKNSWVSGIRKEFITISALPDSELFVFTFKPGGAFPFIQQSVENLSDKILTGVEVFGEPIEELRNDLLACGDSEEKISIGEKWLLSICTEEPVPNTVASNAADSIVQDPTANSLVQLAKQSGYSQKQFISLFKKHVGIAPKAFQRIIRFSETVKMIQKKEKVHWAQLSVDCGYFDQAHFIKDFQLFSGFSPKEFIDKNHTRENFFPLDQ